jgi:peptide/nickel transport system permease protein
VVTVLAFRLGFVIGAAVVIEIVFSYPGMGLLAADAMATRDFLAVHAFLLVVAAMVVAINLLLNLSYAVIDPRIRYV